MADLENGYTRIANEILENMAKVKLSPTQYRILFIVWRYTYGFRRKTHQLSLTFLSEATECDLRLIQRELKKLIQMDILQSEQKKGKTREIGFNKNIGCWKIDNGKTSIGETAIGEIDNGQIDNITIGEIDNGTIGEIDNQERKKEKYKESDFESVFNFYLSLDLIKHRAYTKDIQKAISKAVKDNKYTIEYCKTLIERHKEVVETTKKQEYPVKARGVAEFFGQKVYGATHLICSEYEEGGKYYEQYLKEKPKEIDTRNGIPPSDSVLGEREEEWI